MRRFDVYCHMPVVKILLGEAMHIACYLINRSLSKSLNGNYPKKVWTKNDTQFKHLRVFGCKIFVHVPKVPRTKLDNKSRPYIFFEYGSEKVYL